MTNASAQRGSILLKASLLIFILCLTAAGAVAWRLRQNAAHSVTPDSPHPSLTLPQDNVLSPDIEIDIQLAKQQEELQENLIDPLRQYYATQDTRLTHIQVAAVDNETYPIEVTVALANEDLGSEERLFLYDLTPWNPSMLDNQPEETE